MSVSWGALWTWSSARSDMARIPIPPPSQPIVDEEGKWTVPWYDVIHRLVNDPPPVGNVFGTLATTSTAQVAIGEIPAGAIHTQTLVRVKTTGATELRVGTTANTSYYVTTADLSVETTGLLISDRNVGDVYDSPQTVYANYTSTGTSAETDIVLVYVTTGT
jgi:hypothetical protein